MEKILDIPHISRLVLQYTPLWCPAVGAPQICSNTTELIRRKSLQRMAGAVPIRPEELSVKLAFREKEMKAAFLLYQKKKTFLFTDVQVFQFSVLMRVR